MWNSDEYFPSLIQKLVDHTIKTAYFDENTKTLLIGTTTGLVKKFKIN